MAPAAQRPPWFYRQSGVIAYREGDAGLEVLLVTSRKRQRWVIPKGIIEPGLSAADSAAREALEEAGLVGRLSSAPVGSFRYSKWHGQCHVEVFLLQVDQVLDDWPEAAWRKRRWIPATKAADHVREAELKALLGRLDQLVAASKPLRH